MGIGIRELLVIAGIILVVVIIFDGWRRMRASKNKLSEEQTDKHLEQNFSASESDDFDPLFSGQSTPNESTDNLIEEQAETNIFVEELLEDSELTDEADQEVLEDWNQPISTLLDKDDLGDDLLAEQEDDELDNVVATNELVDEQGPEIPSLFAEIEAEEAEIQAMIDALRTDKVINNLAPEPDQVIAITVLASAEQQIPGKALMKKLKEAEIRFSDMNIFHYFEQGNELAEVEFSIANALNPGTFDINKLADTDTKVRGLSFFMSMAQSTNPKAAFEHMLELAEKIATDMNAQLLDGNRSMLRPQTKDYYRKRISEFSRRNKISGQY